MCRGFNSLLNHSGDSALPAGSFFILQAFVFIIDFDIMQSIQIIGTQRSGSNMLRLMLNQVPEIAAPHPPHILLNFFPLLPKYGDLEQPDHFQQLAEDICDFVKANPVSWEIDDLQPATLVERCGHHGLIDLYTAIYEEYAIRNQATMWCNKSMANFRFIPEIEAQGLRPIYIHLVRDGRDVAASFRKAIVGEKHIYHLARQWKQDQENSERFAQLYAADKYILLSYEDLIHEPEQTMQKLLDRLHLRFDSEVMSFYKTEEAKHTAEAGKMWNNVTQPVMKKNSNKFLTQLSSADIDLFESIAGDTLSHYGYKLHGNRDNYRSSFSEAEIAAFDVLNKKMKEEASSTLDPEGSKKRKAQEAVIQRIMRR